MEIDILDALEALGYSGPLVEEDQLQQALELGPKSLEFTILTAWLSSELQTLCELEDVIHSIDDTDESSTFLLEVSSFLKELYCPYDCLIEGYINQRLGTKKDRIIFLNFLCSELRTARILYLRDNIKKKSLEIELNASDVAIALTSLLTKLNIEVTFSENSKKLFEEIETKVMEVDPNLITEPAFQGEMSTDQWASLQRLQDDMQSEYRMRREMLLNRLDVTILSFKWGENSKGKEDLIAKKFQPLRSKLKKEPSVHIFDILAAREDVVIVQKTSSAALLKNTSTSVHKVIIGHVPDRGGRPKEQRPPVEMPGFSKRYEGGRGGFGGGGQYHGRGKKNWGKGDRNWKMK